MTTQDVVQGFSELNRALMYTSAILAPAQAVSAIGHSGISNLGFLAYNLYTQVVWYRAFMNDELHALALVIVHANTTLAIAYLGGVFSSNRIMAALLALGTTGLMCLNNVTAWRSWKTGQAQGYGEWEFFFFGWRTLTHGWHKFILVWQIANSLETFMLSIWCIARAAWMMFRKKDGAKKKFHWWHRFPAVLIGGAFMTFFVCPYIIWIELLIRRNGIRSETDWVAVYVFIAQVVLMLLPDLGKCVKSVGKDNNGVDEGNGEEYYSLRKQVGYTGSVKDLKGEIAGLYRELRSDSKP